MELSARWFSDRSVTIGPFARHQVADVVEALANRLPGCGVRAGLDRVLVETRIPSPDLLARVQEALPAIELRAATQFDDQESSAHDSTVIRVAVEYGGEDSASVARDLGIEESELATAHQATTWHVAMLGFAPGFAYLTALRSDDSRYPITLWDAIARRSSPRTSVPAGSVAVAAGMTAVYPTAMPGGWQIIGRSEVQMFDPEDPDRPTLLVPGDVVRFVERESRP